MRRTPYARAMNNSWLSLIAALSGQRVSTPATWPVREVHRLCDVCVAKSAAAGRLRPPQRSGGPLLPAR